MKKTLFILVDGDTGDSGYEFNVSAPRVFTTEPEAKQELWDGLDNLLRDDPKGEVNVTRTENSYTYTNGDTLIHGEVFPVEVEV